VSPARVCSNFLSFLGGFLGAGTGPVGERGSWQQCAAVPRHSLYRLNTSNDSPPQKRSRADKVQALVGLHDIEVIMKNKRIRWAASVYARHIPELHDIAEPILRRALGEDTELRWVRGVGSEESKVELRELVGGEVEEWSDGTGWV